MFEINHEGFLIIAALIYSIVFIGTSISFLKYKDRLNENKIMGLGIGLMILAIGLFSIKSFFIFPLFNFLTLLLGVVLLFIGFFSNPKEKN